MKVFSILVLSSTGLPSGPAAPCVDLSGSWRIACTSRGAPSSTLIERITQVGCTDMIFNGRRYVFGKETTDVETKGASERLYRYRVLWDADGKGWRLDYETEEREALSGGRVNGQGYRRLRQAEGGGLVEDTYERVVRTAPHEAPQTLERQSHCRPLSY